MHVPSQLKPRAAVLRVPRPCRIIQQHPSRRHRLAPTALPGWDVAEAAQAVSLTALSSLLTAAWMRRRQDGAGEAEAQPEQRQGAEPQAPPSPTLSCAAEVWAAAWAAFAGGGEAAPGAPTGDEAPAQPLLWVHGIAPSARVQLLALSLAALQAQVAALPCDVRTVLDAGRWAATCPQVLAAASSAAAAAWLGYVPRSLRELLDAQASGAAGEAALYGLEERAALYCSVLRLLKSSSIQPDPAEEEPSSSSSSYSISSSSAGGTSTAGNGALDGGVGSGGGVLPGGAAQRRAERGLALHADGFPTSASLRCVACLATSPRAESRILRGTRPACMACSLRRSARFNSATWRCGVQGVAGGAGGGALLLAAGGPRAQRPPRHGGPHLRRRRGRLSG